MLPFLNSFILNSFPQQFRFLICQKFPDPWTVTSFRRTRDLMILHPVITTGKSWAHPWCQCKRQMHGWYPPRSVPSVERCQCLGHARKGCTVGLGEITWHWLEGRRYDGRSGQEEITLFNTEPSFWHWLRLFLYSSGKMKRLRKWWRN